MEKKEKDNQPYISLLERENSMIKKDKNKIALNYNRAIKDQLNLHETNIRLKEQIREIERSPSQNKNAINQVFNDPETQDQVAKELVGVARLQKQVLILEKSNNSLRNTKSIKQQALLKKLDAKDLEIEILKDSLIARDKEIKLF